MVWVAKKNRDEATVVESTNARLVFPLLFRMVFQIPVYGLDHEMLWFAHERGVQSAGGARGASPEPLEQAGVAKHVQTGEGQSGV